MNPEQSSSIFPSSSNNNNNNNIYCPEYEGQQEGPSAAAKGKFAADLSAFRLHSSPGQANHASESESASLAGPATSSKPRRQSTLAHSYLDQDDVDLENDNEDEEDEDQGMQGPVSPTRLHPPVEIDYTKSHSKRHASPMPIPLPSPSSRPGSSDWSMSLLQEQQPDDDSSSKPHSLSSFNPLNPGNSTKSRSPSASFDPSAVSAAASAAASASASASGRAPTPPSAQTTPMFSTSPSNAQSLVNVHLNRAKSSPSLRGAAHRRMRSPTATSDSADSRSRPASRDRALTPEQDLMSDAAPASAMGGPGGAGGDDDDAPDEGIQSSFDALGMSLPQQGEDILPSPIHRGPVRRPVTRRVSLLPKSKQHLRVAQQLEDETTKSNVDDEVLSEAALHRLNSSRPSVSFPSTSKAFMAPSSPVQAHTQLPTANRFPESAGDDDDDRHGSRNPPSSDSEGDEVVSTQFEMEEDTQLPLSSAAPAAGGSSIPASEGGTNTDAEHKDREAWFGFRERPSPFSHTPASSGSANASMAAAASRPGKRKVASEERFEPYSSMSFKRRAVSPSASLSPGLASPTLSQGSGSYTGPISVPQPPGGSGLNSSGNNTSFSPKSFSRGSSPAPASATYKERLYATGEAAALGLYLSQHMAAGEGSSNSNSSSNHGRASTEDADTDSGQIAREVEMRL